MDDRVQRQGTHAARFLAACSVAMAAQNRGTGAKRPASYDSLLAGARAGKAAFQAGGNAIVQALDWAMSEERWDEALDLARAAHHAQPSDVNMTMRLGMCAEQAGRYEEAMRAYAAVGKATTGGDAEFRAAACALRLDQMESAEIFLTNALTKAHTVTCEEFLRDPVYAPLLKRDRIKTALETRKQLDESQRPPHYRP